RDKTQMENPTYLLSGFHVQTNCFAVRSALLQRANIQFSEMLRICEDYYLFWPAVAAAGKISYIPEPLAVIYATPGSLSRSSDRCRHFRSDLTAISSVLDWGRRAGYLAKMERPLS